MLNSRSSILPSFSALDTLVSNTANPNVTMSVIFATFTSFFWYFVVSTIAMPLTLTPARDIAPKGILTGRLISVLSIATLNVPEATLRLLKQAFSHVSRSKALEYFSCFFSYLSFSLTNSCRFLGPHLCGKILGPKELKAEVGNVNTHCNSSYFLKGVMKMADVDIDSFSEHDKTDTQPDETGEKLLSPWEE